MARCPSCQHEVSALFHSFRGSVFLQNMFRSPANRFFICGNCGATLTMTTSSFIFCQVAFVLIVIPCAIVFARVQTWLVHSSELLQEFSTESPNMAVVFLWILPTLIVTLVIHSELAKRFVEFQKAE